MVPLGRVGCCDQRASQLPRLGWRDDRDIGAVNHDLAQSVPVGELQADHRYHDVGASPVAGGVLDSSLRAIECPEGCADVVAFVDPGFPGGRCKVGFHG